MEFSGKPRKQHRDFQGLLNKNDIEFPGDQEKNVEFPGALVALEFLRGLTQLCGISWGEALFSLEFPGVK